MSLGAHKTSFDKGVWAEEMAVQRLEAKGFDVLHTRYKTRYGEIDVIAVLDDVLVFVEVKARGRISDSLYAITPRNRRRIEQTAMHFIAENPEYNDYGMRFDVMAFGRDSKAGGILAEHLDNAWELGA